MLKLKHLIYFLIFTFATNQGYSQTWQWAKQIGGSNYDGGAIQTLDNGDFFCYGNFSGICYFQTDTLISNGANDMFLGAYDNNGNELWVKKIGGNNPLNSKESGGIVIDKINNYLYFSGRFYGTMIIDNDTLTSLSLDPFLAKFDFNGNCLWAIKATSQGGFDRGTAALVDNSTGNVYWTGILEANGMLDTINLQKGSFLAKISSSGNIIWAKTEFIDIDPTCLKQQNDNLFFGGITRNDTASVDTSILIGPDSEDAFLCRTDTNGNVIWAKRFGGPIDDYLTSIDFDANNNLFICGTFKDILIFKDTITTSAFSDGFIAKLDLYGNLIWLRQSHSSNNGDVWGSTLAADGDGNTYFIGVLHSGSSTFGQFTISTTNYNDMFLTRYDPNGNCLGIRQFGYAEGYQVQMDALGKVYCSGLFVTHRQSTSCLLSNKMLDLRYENKSKLERINRRLEEVRNQ